MAKSVKCTRVAVESSAIDSCNLLEVRNDWPIFPRFIYISIFLLRRVIFIIRFCCRA